MSQSLYRKYRSRGFDEIVGQRHVTDLLATAVKNGAISHAYLFTGPRGTGKTSVARILAHEINGLPYTDDSTHLDIIEIDAASNRRIDDIRDLREKVHIAPSSASYKVYIIDEVHMLTGESFNALLKTLEEPPAHAIFILATTELHKVPATIISRTQRFHFRPGTADDIVAHLKNIASSENISIDDDALRLIAQHSEGGFRDSVSLLDQASSLSTTAITRNDIESLLGLAPETVMNTILGHISDDTPLDAIPRIITLIDEGASPASIIDQLLAAAARKALSQPKLYRLIQVLLEIPRGNLLQLRLIAAIASLDPSSTPPSPSGPKDDSPVVSSAPTAPLVKPVPVPAAIPRETPAPQPAVKETNRAAVAHSAADQALPPDFNWDTVLQHLKKDAPAIYSVAKHAVAIVDGARLTLTFHYALHRKKMESDKYRLHLVQIIQDMYAVAPEIVAENEAEPVLNTKMSEVADIMGGGEAVQLPSQGK